MDPDPDPGGPKTYGSGSATLITETGFKYCSFAGNLAIFSWDTYKIEIIGAEVEPGPASYGTGAQR
jgi:hypothetical protein